MGAGDLAVFLTGVEAGAGDLLGLGGLRNFGVPGGFALGVFAAGDFSTLGAPFTGVLRSG